VFGANITNVSVIAKAFIWNTEPVMGQVVISSPIDLTPGNTTIVNCTSYVWDYNGWLDIMPLNATFYHYYESTNYGADDNNNHYSNKTCKCYQVDASPTNASCECTFKVWYYASNGTWMCNFTVRDKGGTATPLRKINNTASLNSTGEINPVLGINTQDTIDFGNLSVTETSGYVRANITNWGNVPINISVRGFGGTDETWPDVGNYSMLCEFGGNISVGYQRYSISNTTVFASMINLTNTTTLIEPWSLPVRTNDTAYGKDRNVTYWKLNVPLSVGGMCNGTVIFSASIS
jgi:hypothetical protein